MHGATKPLLVDLNQHITCKLCGGYFIDATTIIECLHSFCRSCIVQYLAAHKYCPVCDVQVHKTKPLLNIRPDKSLQDVVYKLVPRLLQGELQRRRDFCAANPDKAPPSIHDYYTHVIQSDESISMTLFYHGFPESARYLRCPAAVSVAHLQKLIRAKYDLNSRHHVDILYNEECLSAPLTLTDVAYIHSWKRKAPLDLSYRIYERTITKTEDSSTVNNNSWKEVQLRISENGEMSITGIQDEIVELANNNNYKIEAPPIKEEPKVEPIMEEKLAPPPPIPKGVKRKVDTPLELPGPSPPKQPLIKKEEFIKPSPVRAPPRPGTPKPPPPKPCYMPKAVLQVPKPGPSANNKIKTKASTPIGYKTLRDPPKSWNSQISRANVKMAPPSPQTDVKPAKFFKMRNNMPRYLGNPASGVKPMYQVHVSPEKDKAGTPTKPNSPSGSEIRKHSIVKIDPKTLRPISKKAPETSSLTNNGSDLKINISSVPIFNPLKLQSGRKSPHSPKNELVPKRDKLSLNFTPSNPFIPNLASPTVSPNQFLYPGAPPPRPFPSYDPRLMAAYHSLFYGQRMAYTQNFNMDLKNYRDLFKSEAGSSRALMSPPAKAPKKVKELGALQNAVEKLTQNRAKEMAEAPKEEPDETKVPKVEESADESGKSAV